MQHNSAELPSTLSATGENAMPTTSKSPTSQLLPRAANNPRFAITPETMGMNFRSESFAVTGTQQLQCTTPVAVDVKSCHERHSKYSAASLADCKPELSATILRLDTNRPGTSAGHCWPFGPTNKTELMTQSPSPITSSPPTPQQQWNFQQTTNTENPQTHDKMPADIYCILQTLKCAEESSKTGGGQPLSKTSAADHGRSQNATCLPQTQTQCHDFGPSDAAKLNFKCINDKYAKRIEDIDANAWGDKDLKIFTYEEWVELLIKINEAFLSNLEELEREVAGRLDLMQRRVNTNCRHSQGNELMKCRKDIDTLLKFIKNTNSHKNWDFLRSLTLETLTPDQVLYMFDVDSLTSEDNAGDEIKNCNDTDAVQKNKLFANMKALAQEVAEKHDEVRELKRQVICLEDEIQKAQKKIQLKDDVIKELRNDLKCASHKIASNPPSETSLSMPFTSFESPIACSANTQITDHVSGFQVQDNGGQIDALDHSELEEQEKIKMLRDEISDLFEINDINKLQTEQHKKKVREIVAQAVSEKFEAHRKLDSIRQQLIDLECESSDGKTDCDSGFRSNSDSDQNTRLLDAIRQRLRRRNETICELKKKVQKLELEKNELSISLETEASFSRRSSGVLRQVADLLCDMSGKHFSYTGIYIPGAAQMNPFCEAIMEMEKNFKEKEAQLLEALWNRNKENEELTQLLVQNEKDFNQERTLRSNLNDFEDIDKTPVALLSCTPSPPSPPPPPPSQAQLPSKSSPTSCTAQQSDNIPLTTLSRLAEESPCAKDSFL